MKFNQKDVKFFVNKDEGIVVAYLDHDATTKFKIKNTRELLKGASDRMTYRICDKYFDVYHEPFTFKAVAKLYPGDEWNEEKGKRIAMNKLQYKLKKYVIHCLKKMHEKMYNIHILIERHIREEEDGLDYLSKKVKGVL